MAQLTPALIASKRVFVGTADLACLGSRVLLSSAVPHTTHSGFVANNIACSQSRERSSALATFIIVNAKVAADETTGLALHITQTLEAAHVEEIVVLGALHWPQLKRGTVFLHGVNRHDAKLASMPAQAILNDPLLASLFHFCTLRALPATFLLTPGSKATTRAKSDGTATEAEALGAALHAFGLTYSAAEFQKLEPQSLSDASDIRSQFLMYN